MSEEMAMAFDGFTIENSSSIVPQFNEENMELKIDFDVIEGYKGIGIFQQLGDLFGAKNGDNAMEAYRIRIDQIDRTNRAKADILQQKLQVFKEICQSWQNAQVKIAETTIRIESDSMVITLPKDINPEILANILSKVIPS